MDIVQIEAIRSCMANMGVDPVSGGMASNANPAVDPAAVAKFQQLMAEPVAVNRVDSGDKVQMPVPFAHRVAEAFREQQVEYQGHLAKITDLLDVSDGSIPDQMDLIRLQYEVQAMNFQETIVSKVIESASSAIQTLIKNS